MEEAAANLERRMEAVFVADEIVLAEEARQTPPTPVHSDVADAGTTKDSENDK